MYKKEKIITSLLLGVHGVNGLFPLALGVNEELAKTEKAEGAKPAIYTSVAYQALETIDDLIFSKAEGADVDVKSGEVTSGLNVNGYTVNVLSGGKAIGGEVFSGGRQNISSGGHAEGTLINRSSWQYVYNGATTKDVDVIGGWYYMDQNLFYGEQIVSGGVTEGTKLGRYGKQTIYSGGTANDTIFSNSSGGRQEIYAAGTANRTILTSGNVQIIGYEGEAYNTLVMEGSTQTVQSRGAAVRTEIRGSGAVQNVLSGGASYNTLIVGGTQNFAGPVYLESATLRGAGSLQNLGEGVYAYYVTIEEGTQNVASGGTAIFTVLQGANAKQNLAPGASANDTKITAGTQEVSSGAKTATTQVLGSGGLQIVRQGAEAYDNVLSLGGEQTVEGSARVTTIKEGGTQRIKSGGTATSTTVEGEQTVEGCANHTTIKEGGKQSIYSGGVATSTIVGGKQIIDRGGTALTNVVTGEQEVDGIATDNMIIGSQNIHGVATNNTISGIQTVQSGGSAHNNLVLGGLQVVYAGGRATGTKVQGGTAYLYNNAVNEDLELTNGTLVLQKGADLTGKTLITDGEILLESRERNLLQGAVGTYRIEDLKVNGKKIPVAIGRAFDEPEYVALNNGSSYSPTDNVLTIDKLDGSLDLKITTHLEAHKSDLVVINSVQNSKDNTVQIIFDHGTNLGKNLKGKAKIVKVSSDFNLTGKEGEIGAYTYTPIVEYADGYWNLVGLTINSPSTLATELGKAGTIALGQWREESALDKRMLELRQGNTERGIWASMGNEKNTINGLATSRSNLHLGYDQMVKDDWLGDTVYVGAALSYGDGKTTYPTGQGTLKSYTLGLYGLWQTADDSFLEWTLRHGKLNNSFDLKDENSLMHAKYGQWGTAASVKTGRHFQLNDNVYLEPYGKVGYGKVRGARFTTSDDVYAERHGLQSLFGKVGVNVGTTLGKDGLIYADLSVAREFKGEERTTFASNGLAPIATKSSLKGTWADLLVGYKQVVDKNCSINGSIGRRGLGNSPVKGKWSWNLGLEFKF